MQPIISKIDPKAKLRLISTLDSDPGSILINLKKFAILSPVVRSMIESVEKPMSGEVFLNFSNEELNDFKEYIKYYGFREVFHQFTATQIKNIKKLIHYFELKELQAYTIGLEKIYDGTFYHKNNNYKGLEYFVSVETDIEKVYFTFKISNIYEYNLVQEFIKDFNIFVSEGEKSIFKIYYGRFVDDCLN